VTGAANDSAGHNNRCREQSALSKAGWSTTWPTSDTFVGDVPRFAGRAENLNSATRHSRILIRYLQGRQAAGRGGGACAPRREGLPILGAGALRSLTGAGCTPLITRSPVPGCCSPRAGLRGKRGAGERSAAAGRRKGSTPPRSWSADVCNSLRKMHDSRTRKRCRLRAKHRKSVSAATGHSAPLLSSEGTSIFSLPPFCSDGSLPGRQRWASGTSPREAASALAREAAVGIPEATGIGAAETPPVGDIVIRRRVMKHLAAAHDAISHDEYEAAA
jgi:hypothetical protein